MSALGDMQTRHGRDAVPLTWNMGWQEEERAQDHARNWHPERCDKASRKCFLLQPVIKPHLFSSSSLDWDRAPQGHTSTSLLATENPECGAPRVTTERWDAQKPDVQCKTGQRASQPGSWKEQTH